MPASLPLKRSAVFFLLLGSASMVFYWTHSLEPDAAMKTDPSLIKARALTDLYPRWYGAREVLFHHRDPYSADVTREIQAAYDGREQRFNYPLYVIFLVAPTIGMQFHSAQIVFWWLLAIVTGFSLGLWLSIIPVQLSLLSRLTLFALVLSSGPVLQGLNLLQFGLLVAGLLCGAVAAVVAGHLFVAGMLLALATIKPPMSLLSIAWFLVWVSGNWRRRQPLLWGFAATLAALIGASEYLVPGWTLRYPDVLGTYTKYADPTPLISVFLPPSLYWPVALGGLLATALFCWRVRREPASSTRFIVAFALVSTLTVMIIPSALSPYNHLLLLPAVPLILHHWTELWSRNFRSRVFLSLFAAMGILPWLLAPFVAVGLLASTRPWIISLRLAPLYVSLLLPFAVLGFLLLLTSALPSSPRAAPASETESIGE